MMTTSSEGWRVMFAAPPVLFVEESQREREKEGGESLQWEHHWIFETGRTKEESRTSSNMAPGFAILSCHPFDILTMSRHLGIGRVVHLQIPDPPAASRVDVVLDGWGVEVGITATGYGTSVSY